MNDFYCETADSGEPPCHGLVQLRAELAAKNAECEALREDAERGRWMVERGSWMRSDEGHTHLYFMVRVADNADLSCRATREDAIDAAMKEKP